MCSLGADAMPRTIVYTVLLLSASCLYAVLGAVAASDAAQKFEVSADIPEQRQALLDILNAVGVGSELVLNNNSLPALGYPGSSSWGAADVSYCWWWGVTCCGTTLTVELPLCSSSQSVSSLDLPAVGLSGTLPDVFQQLPDLQVLDVGHNRGKQRHLAISAQTLGLWAHAYIFVPVDALSRSRGWPCLPWHNEFASHTLCFHASWACTTAATPLLPQ